MDVMLKAELPLKLHSRGKVRDTFELGEDLLMVATDRLSAFDVVFAEPVPMKGAVLTQLSAFWFKQTEKIIRNHLITTDVSKFGAAAQPFAGKLAYRSMLVKRTRPVMVECVVRGYLAGSGLKSYRKGGEICGHRLPAGLKESDALPEPIFTPTTKGEAGQHDLDMSRAQVTEKLGRDLARELEETSLKLYGFAAGYARKKGIIIADTKFEFGMFGDELIFIDEALTPDSSRFWPMDGYEPGKPQPSFDKQFVRDYLERLGWDKSPPPPKLPQEIIGVTSKKYIEAYERLTGTKFPGV